MNLEDLGQDLPTATLLIGPDLDTLARKAVDMIRSCGVAKADMLARHHVSSADARNIVKFAETAPFGPLKVAVAVLDGATAQAQNILLKVLEEPPPTIRFILLATRHPLLTVVSRCHAVVVPGQDDDTEPDAKVTGAVTAALKAAAAADLRGLDLALAGWGDAHHAVLSLQLTEIAAAGDGPGGITRQQARRLLGALARHLSAHPRLAAHAALVTVLSDKESHG